MRSGGSLLRALALALVLVDSGLLVAGAAFRSRPPGRPLGLLSATVAAGMGGARLALPPPGCWLLRFADSECGFCSGQYARGWRTLRAAVRRRGCTVYSLAPSGWDFAKGDGRSSPDVLVLAVSPGFASAAGLEYTPTVEAGVGRRVLWRRLGAFSIRQAMGYLRKLSGRGLFRHRPHAG
jgi:hypothetical protein